MTHWPNLIPLLFLAPYVPWPAVSRAVRSAARTALGPAPIEADGRLPAGETGPT